MKRIILFDLDHSSLDAGERNIFWYSEPFNLKAGITGLINDHPIDQVIELMRFYHSIGDLILIVSARKEETREVNTAWFKKHNLYFDDMYLRKTADERSDDIIKKEMLDEIRIKYGEPYCVFEDNKSVIEMYKKEKIFVFEIHQNNRIIKRNEL